MENRVWRVRAGSPETTQRFQIADPISVQRLIPPVVLRTRPRLSAGLIREKLEPHSSTRAETPRYELLLFHVSFRIDNNVDEIRK